MDVYHILFQCMAWRKERAKMRSTCLLEAGYRPTTVKKLLGERKATPAVMAFLGAIRAGRDHGHRNRESRKTREEGMRHGACKRPHWKAKRKRKQKRREREANGKGKKREKTKEEEDNELWYDTIRREDTKGSEALGWTLKSPHRKTPTAVARATGGVKARHLGAERK